MTFTTLTFGLFLILVFALYWLAPGRRGQNLVLLAASYVFYGWWDPRFCALLLGSSLVDFHVARALSRAESPARRRALLGLSCAVNLGLLGVFKYYGFFAGSLAALLETIGLHASLPTLNVILPVGISFYTFQTLSYTIDVYRREIPARAHALDYLAYVSLFPQLVAGPIERAGRLLPQLERARSFDEARARDGAKQMLWGFCKKIILADHLAEFVDPLFADPTVYASGPVLMVATVCFAFQIYCDFSAYSDMAIGCAKLFGIELVRNFDHPYFSRSVGEFWRRWHMSLSTWFRDYVYVPLGGSRHGPARWWLSLMATFALSGLWHGANWTFVLWGVSNGLLVGLSRPGASTRARTGLLGFVAMLGTFVLICLTWVLFRAVDLPQAMGIYAAMFGDLGRAAAWAELALHRDFLQAFGPLLLAFVLVEWQTRAAAHPLALERWPRALRWSLYTVLLWAAIYLMPDEPDAFIYFQF
jgi:D-alanyl-lipoteichoic acid acyltransferase DltB (MBOAT superfamily)